jgi:two-component system CheB/CheR fusion protein
MAGSPHLDPAGLLGGGLTREEATTMPAENAQEVALGEAPGNVGPRTNSRARGSFPAPNGLLSNVTSEKELARLMHRHAPMNSSSVTQAMSDSLRSLDEIRYALDQAAIVAATDHRGIITYVNDKFCEISRYSRDELLGQDHRIVSSGYHAKEFMRDLWRTIAQGTVWRGEIRNRAKDGSFYWVDTTIVPFLNGQGKPRQYLAIRYDITGRKNAEAQLREQAALAQLGQLAAVVAHEVRNPLAGLRASLQVIDGRCQPRDRSAIAAMIQRIDGLNDKVEDLLLYARPKPPRVQSVDVKALMRDVATSAQASTGRSGLPIQISGDDLKADADPDMLRAALLNVTLNACQAAGRRDVDVHITAENGHCRIAVRDRGPGIPAEVRERVFEPFFTTRTSGTGLGLAIVRRMMELQEGTVTLKDRPDGGTIAEVTVPRASG